MEYGLTETGYTAPRASDFRTTIRDAIDTLFAAAGFSPVDWSTSGDLILSQQVDMLSAQLGQLAEASQDLWDSRRLSAATGQALDDIAAIRGLTRRPATRSTSTAGFGGTTGVVVPAGALIDAYDIDGVYHRWKVTDDVTIPDVSAPIVCTEDGPVTVSVAPLGAQIVTPVAGWETCLVLSVDFAAGRDIESDAALRRRILAGTGTGNTVDSMRVAISGVDGVLSCIVYQNVTAAPYNLPGTAISIPAHTLIAIVYPNTLSTEQQEEVAQAIYDRLPGGIATAGNVYSDIVRDNGQTERVYWRFGTTQAVDVDITLTLADGYALADVEPEITTQIDVLFGAYLLGDTVRILQVYGILNAITGIDSAVVLLDGAGVDVTPGADEVAILGTLTVA